MRPVARAAIVAAVLGLISCSGSAFAEKHYHNHHLYWHRYWGSPYGYTYRRYNPDLRCTLAGCCPAGWVAEGGACKPYRGY